MVQDLEQRVQKSKDNVEEIQKVMATWNNTPLFERKEHIKNEALLNLDDRDDRLRKRYSVHHLSKHCIIYIATI